MSPTSQPTTPSPTAASSPQPPPEQRTQAAEPDGELCAGDVMTTHLLTVDASDGLLLTWELVQGADVHHAPVIEQGRCLGVLAERDLAVEVARNPLGQGRRLVRELLHDLPVYVHAETPVATVARTMLDTGKDAVLVHSSTGQLLGLVTVRDVLRAAAGQVAARSSGDDWDYSPALFRLMPVLPSPSAGGRA